MTERTSVQRDSRAAREGLGVLGALVALFAITSAWWALAFWPVDDGPAWLERTRLVCFGVTGSGLPDAGSWIGLTLGPLGMLAILVVGWSGDVRNLMRRARVSRPVSATLVALALGCTILVTAAGTRVLQERSLRELATAPDDVPGDIPRLDQPAPDLTLIAHDGTTRSLSQSAGRAVLVTFAFAHCETVCPIVVHDVLEAQTILRSRGHSVDLMIVTLDPWRDTPSRLAAMAESWKLPATGAWFLGGSVEDVEAALDAWGVPRVRNRDTGDVTHPALIFVVDDEGRIAFASNGGTNALVSLVERLR